MECSRSQNHQPDAKVQDGGAESFGSSSAHFHSKTYDNPRGEIRTQLLHEWISRWLEQNPQCEQIVDIGCGDGRLSLQLALVNPRLKVILSDPSRAMRTKVEERLEVLALGARASVTDVSLERIGELPISQNSIVLCHGVLNWVAEPERCLSRLSELCEDRNSALSLLFGNRVGHMLSFARTGAWDKCESLVRDPAARISSELSSEGLRLFDPNEILDWLKSSRDEAWIVRGLRCVSDQLPANELKERFDEILAIERMCAEDPRYFPIANMIHILSSTGQSR